MRVAAFDIGSVNFAWYVEDFEIDKSPEDEGVPVSFGVKNITGATELETVKNLISLLNSLKEILAECDSVLVEKQFSSRRFGVNIKAVKLASAVCTWALCSGIECVRYVSASSKTKRAEIKLSKSERKTWCKNRAIEILESRLDYKTITSLEEIAKTNKITDITDCFCYVLFFRGG